MNKYDNFIIYKITEIANPEIMYIGSTLNYNRRKYQHIKNCSNRVSKKYKYPLYKYVRQCGGFDKFDFSIVEKYPCKTKGEGLQREKELIDLYNCKLNKNRPIK